VGADGTANLNGADNVVTAIGPIAGTVNLGAGSLIDISYGTLRGVNGTLGGPATINPGGSVVGGGTINGPVTVDGTIAPSGVAGATGPAAGTGVAGSVLTTGDLTLGAGSTTQIRTDSSGASDSITVNGTASLGGQLAVLPTAAGGAYKPVTRYTVIRTTNGINGAYASVSGLANLPFLDTAVTQEGNNLVLTYSQAGSGLGTGGTPLNQFPGQNTNQSGATTVLQDMAVSGVATGTDPLPTLLGNIRGLTADQALTAFDSLTGETYASAANAELAGQSQYQDTVFNRLKLQRDTGEQGPAVWAEPYTSSSTFDTSAESAHTDYRIHGVIVGADAPVTPDLRLGVHANFANSRTEVDRRGDYTDVDQAAIGLHALYFNDSQWWAEGLASYGWQNADSTRRINVGGFTPQADGSYNGKTKNASLEGGYRFPVGKSLHLEPFVGAYYSKVKYDAFTEKHAGDADLRVGNASATSMQYGAGARLVGDVDLGVEGTKLHPIVMVRYLHNTKDQTVTVNNQFADAPTQSFTVQGSRPVQNHWQAGVGMSFDITPKASTFVYYNADVAAHQRTDAVSLGFRWNF
jgi:uncharacterized protein with beta-barrel porin domain